MASVVQRVSAVQTVDTTGISATISAPSSGNLLVLVGAARDSTTTQELTPTNISGWSEGVKVEQSGQDNMDIYLWWKVADGTEGTTVGVDGRKPAMFFAEVSGDWSDLGTNPPNFASDSGSSTSGSTGTTAATTVGDGYSVAALVGFGNVGGYTSWLNSFTEQADLDNGGDGGNRVNLGVADRIETATGTKSSGATLASSAAWGGVIGTFEEAESAVPVTITARSGVAGATVGQATVTSAEAVTVSGSSTAGASAGVATVDISTNATVASPGATGGTGARAQIAVATSATVTGHGTAGTGARGRVSAAVTITAVAGIAGTTARGAATVASAASVTARRASSGTAFVRGVYVRFDSNLITNRYAFAGAKAGRVTVNTSGVQAATVQCRRASAGVAFPRGEYLAGFSLKGGSHAGTVAGRVIVNTGSVATPVTVSAKRNTSGVAFPRGEYLTGLSINARRASAGAGGRRSQRRTTSIRSVIAASAVAGKVTINNPSKVIRSPGGVAGAVSAGTVDAGPRAFTLTVTPGLAGAHMGSVGDPVSREVTLGQNVSSMDYRSQIRHGIPARHG